MTRVTGVTAKRSTMMDGNTRTTRNIGATTESTRRTTNTGPKTNVSSIGSFEGSKLKFARFPKLDYDDHHWKHGHKKSDYYKKGGWGSA